MSKVKVVSETQSHDKLLDQNVGPPGKSSPSMRAFLALAVGIICIGFSAIFVKWADISGPVSAFYRLFIAGVALLPIWLWRRPALPSRSDLILIMAGGAFFGFDLLFWNSGVLLTSATSATLLANNAPIWVGLGAMLIFREKMSIRFWVGLIVSLCGMSVLFGWDAWRRLEFNSGDLLATAGSFFYAAYLLTTSKARVRVDTLTFTTLSALAGAATLLIANLAASTTLTGFTPKSWMALLGMGLISHLGGWLTINYALGHLRAAPTSIALLGQAVVTAFLAIPLLGESLGIHQIIGGMLILSGIYFVNQRRINRAVNNHRRNHRADGA